MRQARPLFIEFDFCDFVDAQVYFLADSFLVCYYCKKIVGVPENSTIRYQQQSAILKIVANLHQFLLSICYVHNKYF